MAPFWRFPLAMIIFFVRFGSASHYLRYGQPNAYTEGTCGQPLWTSINAGSPLPDNALVAGSDSSICDGTICGKDIYVSIVDSAKGVNIGKTWFTRADACSNSAQGGASVTTKNNCRVLTMGSGTFKNVRFDWTAVESTNMVHNRVDAPTNALAAGNNNHGPLYVCRFAHELNAGDSLVGSTWFPRSDGHCCSAEYDGHVVYGNHCEILTTETCQR